MRFKTATGTPSPARRAAGILLGLAAITSVAYSRPAALEPALSCSAPASNLRWIRTAPPNETPQLERWCAGVGPADILPIPSGAPTPSEVPVIVSWNTHEGGGSIDALVADLKAGRLTGRPVTSFVLLLQEVYRTGAAVPGRGPGSPAWASAELSVGPDGTRDDIATVARRLKLGAFYVPSMRNGEPGVTTEDRGNAILSTVPLSDLAAVELPLERQRRVALETTIQVHGPGRDAWPLRLVCTHFTNMVMHHLLVLSESGRLRQARALAGVLPADGALIVGGDFNAWFGYRDAAYKELATRVPPPSSDDRRATFGPMRLDHILFRLPTGWSATVRRTDSRYGSDHYPLVAVIAPPSN